MSRDPDAVADGSDPEVMQRGVETASIIIPAYNEEEGIAATIEQVLAVHPAFREIGIEHVEVVVVDDGSADRTANIAATWPSVRLLRHTSNRGYGAALKTGFNAASGELLGFLDADGTYPPNYLPNLCREALAGADLVVGSRRSGADSDMPVARQLGNFLWSGLVTLLGNRRVADPASGMRVLWRASLERLYPLPDGLNFTPVMSMRAIHEGVNLVEVPIPYTHRVGNSKLNVVGDGLRFLQTILWTALTYNPARLLGGLGASLFAAGGLIAAVLVSMRVAGRTALGPWGVISAFSAVVLAITGVDLFALGATFNYLVSLFHKRPVRRGLFGQPLFQNPLEHHFWWMGLLAAVTGVLLGVVSLVLGLRGWPIERLWLYLLAGSMLVLMGVQLVVFWVVLRVLDELGGREALIKADMGAQ